MLISGLYVQRACDGGCTTRFEFPCSSEARKENIQRRRIRYWMTITSNCWSANKVHEHGQIVRFCHSVADLAWKHHWNTRKLWNNMFSVFFSGVCFQMRYKRMFCHKLGSKRRFGFFRGERGLRAKVTKKPLREDFRIEWSHTASKQVDRSSSLTCRPQGAHTLCYRSHTRSYSHVRHELLNDSKGSSPGLICVRTGSQCTCQAWVKIHLHASAAMLVTNSAAGLWPAPGSVPTLILAGLIPAPGSVPTAATAG